MSSPQSSSFSQAFPVAATVTRPDGSSVAFPSLKMSDWAAVCAEMRKQQLDEANARITREYAKDLDLRERARAAAQKISVTIFEAVDSRRTPEGITRILTRSLKTAKLTDEEIVAVLDEVPAYPAQADLAYAVSSYNPQQATSPANPPAPKAEAEPSSSQQQPNQTGASLSPESSTTSPVETPTT